MTTVPHRFKRPDNIFPYTEPFRFNQFREPVAELHVDRGVFAQASGVVVVGVRIVQIAELEPAVKQADRTGPVFVEAIGSKDRGAPVGNARSEEHTSELQSLMRISYAVFCLKKKHLQEINHTK